jgi:hypothetical protein
MAVISRAVRTSVVTLALAAGLATTAVAQNAMRTAPVPEAPTGETPDVLQQIGFDQRLDAQLPLDLLFVDERGETVELGSYFGSVRSCWRSSTTSARCSARRCSTG